MNLPNQLTVARIGMTFLMVVFLTTPGIPFGKTIALAIFVAASITDYWDGRLARSSNRITAFGQLMDPLADKVLVCAAFVSFVAIDQIVPAWVVITIITREFLVTGLRLLAVGKGRILEAGRFGKHKTVWQIVVIVVVITGLALREDLIPLLPVPDFRAVFHEYYSGYFTYLTHLLSAGAAFLTVVSGVVYYWENRDLVMEHI